MHSTGAQVWMEGRGKNADPKITNRELSGGEGVQSPMRRPLTVNVAAPTYRQGPGYRSSTRRDDVGPHSMCEVTCWRVSAGRHLGTSSLWCVFRYGTLLCSRACILHPKTGELAQICGWDYHISFDVLFEGLWHHLIDLVALLRARDHRQLLGLRDLLTSLKVDSGECTCTGQFSLYKHSFQDLGQADNAAIRAIAPGSRLLHSIVLDGGAAKWGLLWLRSEYRELGQAPLL